MAGRSTRRLGCVAGGEQLVFGQKGVGAVGRIYALLVGINAYPAGVRPLHGCVNDVGRYRDYLTGRFAPEALAIETLLDGDATRENVIRQFRQHLCRAGEDDVALFQYCGHGAQSTAAAEFLSFDPTGKEQGLVCHDSRTPDKFDLADKELAALIAEVAKKNPHVAVIVDACHSGSGTRSAEEIVGAVARFEKEAPYKREVGQYLDEYYLKQGANIMIPAARHILLAACDRRQTAKERGGAGIFTSTLIEVLEKSGDDLSYADLFVRCRAAVRKRAADQDPQFETFGGFNAQAGFLGGASRVGRRFRAVYDRGGWRVNCGAIQGLPTDPTRQVAFALYPEDGGDAVGAASALVIGAQESTLALDFDNVPGVLAYAAEMTSLPVAPMVVAFNGPAALRMALEAALAADGMAGVVLAEAAAVTDIAITISGSVAFVVETATGRRVQGIEVDGDGGGDVGRLVSILRSIAAWRRGLDLQNAATKIDRGRIDMVYAVERVDGTVVEHRPGMVPMEYVPGGAPLAGRLKLRNRTGQLLHAALVYFSPEYQIFPLLNVELPVADLAAAAGGWRTIFGDLPEQNWSMQDGVDFSVETLKLIISTERIDDFLLAQDELQIGKIWAGDRGSLNAAKPPEQQVRAYREEWFTEAFTLHLRRKLDMVGQKDAVLAGGAVTVLGHSRITASLAVASAAAGTRDIGGSDLPRALASLGMPLVDFGEGTRGGGSNVLEISGIAHAEALATEPLQIVLKLPLAAEETIVPLVFDGEFMALGGDAERRDDGVVVRVDAVPQTGENTRSLLGSLKLYFVRTALRQENVNSLRRVEVMADGRVERQKFGVADAVDGASRVLLLVHGITGDTAEMAADVVASGIAAKFDLVLTYDYENLGTLIGDTAVAMEQALKGVGLAAGDGKSLTILAHSMGGLVSRCFIERGGGRDTVDHLVMCGTPNGGSPLGKVGGAMAIARLLGDFAANVAPASLPFVAPLRAVLKAAGGVTKSLEQMNPASNFILELNASDDPGVRYTILAGSIDAYVAAGDAFAGRAVVAAGRSAAFDLLFENQPNDIAVGVESIKTIGGVRALKPVRHDVACHHLNYFSCSAGRAALQAVAW